MIFLLIFNNLFSWTSKQDKIPLFYNSLSNINNNSDAAKSAFLRNHAIVMLYAMVFTTIFNSN